MVFLTSSQFMFGMVPGGAGRASCVGLEEDDDPEVDWSVMAGLTI